MDSGKLKPLAEDVDRISRVFALTQMPANVRASQRVERMFIKRAVLGVVRRLKYWALGTRWISSEGRFTYRRGSETREVVFNGRNMQFHALYDECYGHGYELETGWLLTKLCQGNGAFYDVGSNWGYFALLLAAMEEFTGPIIAFEPNPRTFADLTSVLRQAGVENRVKACQLGLGRESCTMNLMETDEFYTGYARLASSGTGGQIAVKRLDDLDFPPPAMIKIDAEGMETDVLAGGTRILSTARPFVMLENFLDYNSPKRTYAPFEILWAHQYRLFVPVLLFAKEGKTVMATYGADPGPLLAVDPAPRLGMFAVTAANRYLFSMQLNILAVPANRVVELWAAGLVNLNDVPAP